MELYEAALKYADYGFHVFPLAPRSKSPMQGTHGVKDATDDPASILAKWKREPEANIGIATGKSGLVALDVDPRDGGANTLRELEREHGSLPETLTARSGGADQGVHLIFQAPEGDVKLGTTLGPGVDVRRGGYYIVAPPSIHPDTGNEYQWVSKKQPAELPDWVVNELTQPKTDNAEVPEEAGETSSYGKTVLDGETARVLSTSEGSRNNTLFKAAVRVYELTKGGEIERQYADRLLERAGIATGLPRNEVEGTLESAWERAQPVKPDKEGPELPSGSDLDFLTIGDLREMPPPRWLIPNMLPEGLTTLYGPPKVGKTFVALDWTLALAATGKRIVYCVGEGLKGFRRRIDAWVESNPDSDPAPNFLMLGGGAFPRFLEEHSVRRFKRNIAGLAENDQAPDLVVIDTWSRSLRGGSDSSDQDSGEGIGVLDDLRNEYDVNGLVIHHSRKPGRDGAPPPPRGSGALRGASDCVWAARDHDYGLILYNDDMKDDESQPSVKIQLRKSGSSVVPKPTSLDLLRKA